MSKIFAKIRLAAALPLAIGFVSLAPVAVYAQESNDTTPNTSSDGSNPASETGAKAETTDDVSARGKARELLTQERQTLKKQHTEEQKQKACEAHATNINMRANNYAAAAQRHLANFNAIFTKVQAFHDKKQLNVTNYDALIAAATAKQTTAQAAVDALKAVDVKIDCTQSDPATAVATLKTATANARTALQDYRTAIKNVIVALEGASSANKTGDANTGGNQ